MIYLLMCLVGLTVASNEYDSGNIVEIRNGKIQGKTIKSFQNKTLYLFLEIPFAQPPIGNLRFKDPLPARNWTGVLNATQNTKICWETRFPPRKHDPRQNEDCLYLNVYSPMPPGSRKELLPVFVHVYGGQYLYGNAAHGKFDPQQLVDSGIVAVTMNYRSGPLGFLTTEDGVISANRGLKDQHLALKWVQENVHFFGGDPSKVTLAGHSSGAMCVSFHLLSSKATGLFRAAIIQSGTALSPTGYTQRARQLAFEMGRQLSPVFSYKNTSEDLLKILLEASPRKISSMDFPHLLVNNNLIEKILGNLYWRPTIEKPDIPNAYLTRLPHDSMLTGNFQRVPLLTGMTSEEYIMIYKSDKSLALEISPGALLFEKDNIKWGFRNFLEDRIKGLYTNQSIEEDHTAIVKYIGDYVFHSSSIRFAELHARYAETYFYKFSYCGKINELIDKHIINIDGLDNVGHSEDIAYLLFFRGNPAEYHKFPASDLLTQKRLVHLLANFVKYMNPTPKQELLTNYIKWPQVSKNDFTYLDINTNLSVIKDFPRPLYREWVMMIDNYYRHPLGSL